MHYLYDSKAGKFGMNNDNPLYDQTLAHTETSK